MSELKVYGVLAALVLIGGAAIQVNMYTGKKAQAVRVLEQQDIQPIQIGMGIFGCSESDGFNFKFVGVNDKGTRVSGHVCSGVFKGATVRFD